MLGTSWLDKLTNWLVAWSMCWS